MNHGFQNSFDELQLHSDVVFIFYVMFIIFLRFECAQWPILLSAIGVGTKCTDISELGSNITIILQNSETEINTDCNTVLMHIFKFLNYFRSI